MRCPKCARDNPDDAKFCVGCGNPIRRGCAKCGTENPADASFCKQCGTRLGGIAAPSAAAARSERISVSAEQADSAALDGERKTVTVLFADIKGSMDLEDGIDPEDARAIVDPALKLMIDAVHHYEGYVAQSTGDGIFALFGAPVAHEDDPQRALHAALRLQEHLHRYSVKQRESGQAGIDARVGVHTGEVVLRSIKTTEGRGEYVPVGHSVGLAARLQALAPVGSIAASEAMRKLCEGYFNFRSLGPTRVKGVSETLEVHEVTGLGPLRTRLQRSAARGLTRFIGREDEMRMLWNRWELAREGEGQLVLIVGEAGIGKSRVMHQFHERLVGSSHRWIEGAAEPYFQNTPFHAVVAMVNQALGLNADQTPDELLDRLESALKQNGINASEAVALLAQLLNLPVGERFLESKLPPEQARQRLLATLAKTLFALAALQPMVLALEDLHWADASTLEFLELLVEQAATSPVMVLVTARPEFDAPWPARSHNAQITLGRLRDREVREMVASVAAKMALTNEAIDAVTSRASGVPLFVEELTRAVMETGGALGGREIPATLHDSLMARLDRLGPAKEVVQVGSVLGREFSYELIRAVHPIAELDLLTALRGATDAELIHARGIAPDATYQFKHTLIRDAAYDALLKSRRKELHSRTAEVLASQFTETVTLAPQLLALHYTEAGLIEQAVPYWEQAGRRARKRSAHLEAISHFTKALELLGSTPDSPERTQREIALQVALGGSLRATKGYSVDEVQRVYTRASQLCQQAGETSKLFSVLSGLCSFYLVRAHFKEARDYGQQLLTLAQRLQNPVFLLAAHELVGASHLWSGEFALAREHLECGISLGDPQQRRGHALSAVQDPEVACLTFSAVVLWFLGYPDQAQNRIHETVVLAQELAHPYSLAFALTHVAFIYHKCRDVRAAQEQSEALITLCREQGFPFFLATGTIHLGWALAGQGQEEDGIAKIREGLSVFRTTASEINWPHLLLTLAEAYGKAGQQEEGLKALAEALTVVDKTGERFHEAELYRLKGQLTLELGQGGNSSNACHASHGAGQPQMDAEACFRRAIEIARQQSAKSWELRATTSLAKLLAQRGSLDEASAMLTDIYNWFTEGFDTADLKDAKVLLDELGD